MTIRRRKVLVHYHPSREGWGKGFGIRGWGGVLAEFHGERGFLFFVSVLTTTTLEPHDVILN